MGGCVVALGLLLLAAAWGDAGGAPAPAPGPGDEARQRLLHQVERDIAECAPSTGVPRLSVAVAAALLNVPRDQFVPPELRARAWENRPLPIGLDQTISQPTIVALMTELLRLAPGDTVLEVGTGSGYQAAILATILPRGFVHTIEILPELAAEARERLRDLGYGNVSVVTGDGHRGLPRAAPFAGIMVTAVGSAVPPALLEQLAAGGRLVMPMVAGDGEQWLTVVRRGARGGWVYERVLRVRFVPLTGGDDGSGER